MKMHKENFGAALVVAIVQIEIRESEAGFRGDSAFLQGLKEALEALKRGEEIQIV